MNKSISLIKKIIYEFHYGMKNFLAIEAICLCIPEEFQAPGANREGLFVSRAF
jgi:hypothetical protein